MIELFRGTVSTWECDEMGHLNVRYYGVKVQEAVAVLGHAIGLGPDDLRTAGAVLAVAEQHLRFLRELHAASGVSIVGGILETDDLEIHAYVELRHAISGETSASVTMPLRLVSLATGEILPVPAEVKAKARALACTLPDYAAPRGLTLHPPRSDAHGTLAAQFGMRTISKGTVGMAHCDERGVMLPAHVIGRVADGVVNFLPALAPEATALRQHGKIGSAVVEYRLCYHRYPRAGDLIEVRTGLKAIAERIIQLVHWIFDPADGGIYATSEAVAVTLDLEARKSMPFPDDVRTALSAHVNPALSL